MPRREISASSNTAYIEPISNCNLACRMCYSRVPGERVAISKEDVVSFVDRFARHCEDDFSLYWCGTGEVFLHEDFPEMINVLGARYRGRAAHTIMTNGTVDRLDEFESLRDVTIRVSIDGPKEHHEWNRGPGTCEKSMGFYSKALSLGCRSVEVRALGTRGNIEKLAEFEAELERVGGSRAKLLVTVAFTNDDLGRMGSQFMARRIDDSKLMPREETERLLVELYGDKFRQSIKEDYCHATELSLTPWGVFTCCESMYKIGEIDTEMAELFAALGRETPKCYQCTYRPGQFEREF